MRRVTPTVYQILAKTHRLTIFLNAPVTATIDDLKAQALPALEQYSSSISTATEDMEEDVPIPIPRDDPIPIVKDLSGFELCKAKRDRLGRVIEYDVLESNAVVRDKLSNWEVIYFRFKDESGNLEEVQVEEPVDPDEVEQPQDTKGKRKEPPT